MRKWFRYWRGDILGYWLTYVPATIAVFSAVTSGQTRKGELQMMELMAYAGACAVGFVIGLINVSNADASDKAEAVTWFREWRSLKTGIEIQQTAPVIETAAPSDIGLPEILGIQGKSIVWARTGVFLVSLIVSDLAWYAILSNSPGVRFPDASSFLTLLLLGEVALTGAALASFRFSIFKNELLSAVLAGIAYAAIILPIRFLIRGLPTSPMMWISNLIYTPLFGILFLSCLSFFPRRLKPLWLGIASASVISSLILTMLSNLVAYLTRPQGAIFGFPSLKDCLFDLIQPAVFTIVLIAALQISWARLPQYTRDKDF